MSREAESNWQTFTGRLLRGHQVASGRSGDPRFPGGTLRMQTPHFLALGLDLTRFFPGTLNVSIAPLRYRVARPRLAFRQVKWHPVEPAEDFSFFDIRLHTGEAPPVEGLIYYPHPETKPQHFQPPDVLEVLLPLVEGLAVGSELRLSTPKEQLRIEPAY